MKYIILIFMITFLYSEKSIHRLTWEAKGRYGFKCFNDSTCYTIDILNHDNQYIFKTTDSGDNWSEVVRFSTDMPPMNLPFGLMDHAYIYNENSFYFYGRDDNGILFWTHDNGDTFKKLNIDVIYNTSNEMLMFDTLRGFIGNDNYLIYTQDGWESWDSLRIYDVLANESQVKNSDSTCLIAGKIYQLDKNNDKVLHDYVYEFNINSLESETKFIFQYLEKGFNDMEKMIFTDDKTGFIVGGIYLDNERRYKDIIYKTTDGGDSWYTVLDEFNCCYILKDIAFNKDMSYGVAVDASKYYETFDGGETWHFGIWERGEGEPNHVYCNVEFAGNRCLIGSMGKGIYAWEEVTSVNLENIGNLKVWQSGSTFRVGSDINELQINIFDLQGNQVNTEHFNKNTIIDLSGKPSGTYLFNIIHQNLIIKSGKLSVVK